jgi:cystathionine beta-lyase
LAERYGVTVLADEIHAPLVLPGAHHVPFESIARETGVRSITLTSASKGWNIAGLKCAIAVSESTWGRATLARLPKDLADRTGHLGVIATIAAFSSDASYLDRVVSHLDVLRETLRRLLAEHGLGAIRYARPDAGFLAWLDCRALDLGPDPSKKFLEDGGVAFTNGLDFGREGSGHVRFNFGTSTGLVEEAVRRMRTALDVERGRRGDVHSPTNL